MLTEEKVYVCEDCIEHGLSLDEDARMLARLKAEGFWTVIENGRAKWGTA